MLVGSVLNNWVVLWVLICMVHLTVCIYHVTYVFRSESTLYSCLNAKELLARNRRDIWSLSDWNGTRSHNHLVRKRILNHLTKLAKWLSCVASTYLYGAFDCVYLSCHVRLSEWIWMLIKHRIKYFSWWGMTADFVCLSKFLKTSSSQKRIKFPKQK